MALIVHDMPLQLEMVDFGQISISTHLHKVLTYFILSCVCSQKIQLSFTKQDVSPKGETLSLMVPLHSHLPEHPPFPGILHFNDLKSQ